MPQCTPLCSTTFRSNSDWDSYAGIATSTGVSPLAGDSFGPSTVVCARPNVPTNCPVGMNGLVIYADGGGSGWGASSYLPDAFWIWRAGVVPSDFADLQVIVFNKTFMLGNDPTGSIQVAADDFAAVFANGLLVGSVGSVSNVAVAAAAQNMPSMFAFSSSLHPGANTISVVGQNGPASFAVGCSAGRCPYAQNPAAVLFEGSLTWR